jgi:hypothetical protein
MIADMALFRNKDLQKLRNEQIIGTIKSQVAKEKRFSGNLAERRRRHMHMMLQNEQEKIRT